MLEIPENFNPEAQPDGAPTANVVSLEEAMESTTPEIPVPELPKNIDTPMANTVTALRESGLNVQTPEDDEADAAMLFNPDGSLRFDASIATAAAIALQESPKSEAAKIARALAAPGPTPESELVERNSNHWMAKTEELLHIWSQGDFREWAEDEYGDTDPGLADPAMLGMAAGQVAVQAVKLAAMDMFLIPAIKTAAGRGVKDAFSSMMKRVGLSWGTKAAARMTEYDDIVQLLTKSLVTQVSAKERVQLLGGMLKMYKAAGFREMREGAFFSLVAGGLTLTDLKGGTLMASEILGGQAATVLVSIPKVTARLMWGAMKRNNITQYNNYVAALGESVDKNANPVVAEILDAALTPLDGPISLRSPLVEAATMKSDVEIVANALSGTQNTELLLGAVQNRDLTGEGIWRMARVPHAADLHTVGRGHQMSGALVFAPVDTRMKPEDMLDLATIANKSGLGKQMDQIEMGRVMRVDGDTAVVRVDGVDKTVPIGLLHRSTGFVMDRKNWEPAIQRLWGVLRKKYTQLPEKFDPEMVKLDYDWSTDAAGRWPTAYGLSSKGLLEAQLAGTRPKSPVVWMMPPIKGDDVLRAKAAKAAVKGQLHIQIPPNVTPDEFLLTLIHEFGHLITPHTGAPGLREFMADEFMLLKAIELGADMNNVRPHRIQRRMAMQGAKGTVDPKTAKQRADKLWELYTAARGVINNKTQVGRHVVAQYPAMLKAGMVEDVAADILYGCQTRGLDFDTVMSYVLNMPGVKKWQAASLDNLTNITRISDSPASQRLNRALSLQETVGHSLAMGMHPEPVEGGKITQYAKTVIMDRMDDETIERFGGGATLNWEKRPEVLSSFKKWISSPSTFLQGWKHDLVDVPFELYLNVGKLQKASTDIMNQATKNLSKDEQKLLTHAIEYARDREVNLIPTFGGLYDPNVGKIVIPMSADGVDSYQAFRALMDQWWVLGNNSMVRHAQKNGFKVTEAGNLIVPVKKVTAALTANVDSLGTRFDPEVHSVFRNPNNPDELFYVPKDGAGYSDVPNGFDIAGKRDGYAPRQYKEDHRVARFKVNDEGSIQVEFVATAETSAEAERVISALTKDDPDYTYLSMRGRDGMVDLGSSNFSTLEGMTPQQLGTLVSELEARGVSEDILRAIRNRTITFSTKRSVHMKQRGEVLKSGKDVIEKGTLHGADDAILMPTGETLALYVRRMAQTTSQGEYMAALEKEFMDTYGHLLPDNAPWHESFKNTAKGAQFQNAQMIQQQMKTIAGIPDDITTKYAQRLRGSADSYFAERADMPENKQKFYKYTEKAINWVIDAMDGAPYKIKSLGSDAKLGLFNMGQFVTQSTGALNTIGAFSLDDPKALAMGTRDFLQAFMWGASTNKLAPLRDIRGQDLWKLAQKSGYFEVVHFDAIQQIIDGNYGKNSAMQSFRDAGRIFYNAGETVNKGMAWFATRAKMLREIDAGKLKLEPDSSAFVSEVNNRAKQLSLNMSKINQPWYSKGIPGATFGMFKQFFGHQMELMFSKDLNVRQRMGIMAAWVGSFGAAGVPFANDLRLMAEGALGEADEVTQFLSDMVAMPNPDKAREGRAAPNTPEHKNALVREVLEFGKEHPELAAALKKGISGIAPVVKDFEIAHRVGLADVLGNYIEGLDWSDLAGPGVMTLGQVAAGVPEMMYDVSSIMFNSETSALEKAGDVMRTGSQNFAALSGPRNMMTAAAGAIEGSVYSKGEKLLDDPTAEELSLMWTGLTPTRLVKARELQGLAIQHKQVWSEFIKKRAIEYRQMQMNNPRMADALMRKDIERISAHEPFMVKKYLKRVTFEIIRNEIPADMRQKFDMYLIRITGGE